VASEQTAVLVDAGLSFKELTRRLEGIGEGATRLQAVCLTHEHGDHTTGVATLHRKVGAALYANRPTLDALERGGKVTGLPWNVFETGQAFPVGDLRVEPFSVPHDAYDPVGFVISQGTLHVGVVSDMGVATELIRQRLKVCQAVVLECNHDPEMVKQVQRPWALKQRILGRQGHLSNAQAAELVGDILWPGLAHVYLAHLSSDCNRGDLALGTVQAGLTRAGRPDVSVHLTYPDRAAEKVVILDSKSGV